jgi:hypothetical protein
MPTPVLCGHSYGFLQKHSLKKDHHMAIIRDTHVAFPAPRQGENTARSSPHENLITDELLTRALGAILDICAADGRMRARQMREAAGLTLCEALQLLIFLHRHGILEDEVDGQRVVNRVLARDYLAILSPSEETRTKERPKEKESFSRAQIAWACMHARAGKLTPMRVARPSRWTIDLARALGRVHVDTPGDFILSTSRAKRLCDLVMDMSEEECAPYISWAVSQLPAGDTLHLACSPTPRSR